MTLRAEPAYYSPGEQVVVEGKRSRLEFGAALTDRARGRLRDLLLFLVGSAVVAPEYDGRDNEYRYRTV
jgi:hypothetical protein